MKKYSYFILGLIASAITACDLTGESNYRPDITLLQQPILNHADSLDVTFEEANSYRLDTIHVGDTVSFFVRTRSFANSLKEFNLTQSSDSVSRIILPAKESLDSIFLSTSDYSKGRFLFSSSANIFYFPFYYVARKASKEAKLIISVTSDASFEYNQSIISLKTPILDTVAVAE